MRNGGKALRYWRDDRTVWRAFRNGLRTIHLWAGLALALPFIAIGVSGSLIVLLTSLDDFKIPVADAIGDAQPLERVLETAESASSSGWSAQTLVLPQKPGEPVSVQFIPPRGHRIGGDRNIQGSTLYIDPVSLKVLGSAERRRAGSFMRELVTLHVALLIPDYYGIRVVGFMGIAMVLFGISGLVLWWPGKGRWRSAFGIKRGGRGYRLNHDLHSVVGFWTLPVFLIVSISGIDLAFPETFQSAVGSILLLKSNFSAPGNVVVMGPPAASSLDNAVKLSLAAVPHAKALSIQLSPRSFDSYMVVLVPSAYGEDAPQISVFVGPGPVVSDVVDPRTYSFGKRIMVWLRVLHYGQGLGVPWQTLVFFSGLLPLLFAITGLRMWWLKRAQRRAVLTTQTGLAAAE